MKIIISLFLVIIPFFCLSQDCEYIKKEKDAFTGDQITIPFPEPLIIFIPKSREDDFDYSLPYLRTVATISKINKDYFLITDWVFNDYETYDLYGYIEQGAKLIIKFQDDSTLTLKSLESTMFDTNIDADTNTYRPLYHLTPAALNKLSTKPISGIRMYWSTGYEDYLNPIPDAVIKTSKCVK